MDKETRKLIDRLQAMVDANLKQADDAKSPFGQGWYFGRVSGLQLVQIILLDDEEFTMETITSQDNTYQKVQNLEELHRKLEEE